MENSNEEYEFIKFDTTFRTWQKLKDILTYRVLKMEER